MSTVQVSSSTEFAVPTPHIAEHDPSQTLKAIIVYYQQERMWIKHTQDVIALARRNRFKNSAVFDVETPVTVNKHSNVPLWKRRKTSRCLHLNDLSPVKLSRTLSSHDAYSSNLLELFAALLEARIESCRRVDQLVSQNTQRRRLILK